MHESLVDLLDAIEKAPDYERIYRIYSFVFDNTLLHGTSFVSIKFKGAHAKASYLLKEHGADLYLTRSINQLRIRLHRFDQRERGRELSEVLQKELQDNYLYDFKALCRFVALVYDCELAESVSSRFSSKRELQESKPHTDVCDCVRLLVERWDEKYIYGTIVEEDAVAVVSYTHDFYDKKNCSWQYLKDFLFDGCQLNLVRPRSKDGVLVPELIIFEPDSLINISEIAGCFQPWATTHLNSLVKKLQENVDTEAILLGNLAGQLLDEEINSQGQSYKESAQLFFSRNAFSLLSTPTSSDFHTKAMYQKQNIHRAFGELPSALSCYDRGQLILEPSFFSPMLGVQGRVDLMQQDFKFLVEQKSGKSAFPQPQRPCEPPRPCEPHYVQLLLYMMVVRYNYRQIYEQNNREFHAFLLYSKYEKSLCGVEFAPELMFEAVRIRNAIACQELDCAKNGFEQLETLTAETFRQKPMRDSFWQAYIQPQLDSVFAPIREASALERKYFYRMLRFVANEHLLAKVGSNQRQDSGLAALWLSSLEQKQQAGNIFKDLVLESPAKDHQGIVEEITLRLSERLDDGTSNFRKGDIVILYPYVKGSLPDACSGIINRCTILEITPQTLRLALRAPQSNARMFLHPLPEDSASVLWAVEHDFIESSYSSAYRGIHAFLTAPKERRDLLLLQRAPLCDQSLSLTGDYGSFNSLGLAVKQAKDLFLIIGPPGTGKTSYGMLNTLKEELTNPASCVLIVSYTNRAVDEICSKLVESGIDFIRLGSRHSADATYHPFLLESKVKECANLKELRAVLTAARVIVGTTTAIASRTAIFGIKSFDLLIIDEASQILEPHLLPILSARHNGVSAVRKIVMIGDHKQLPAVVKQNAEESKVCDEELNSANLFDCRLSLFERLLSRYVDDPRVTYMLTKQGRMHPEIASFPNRAFYQGRLDVVPLAHQRKGTNRTAFIAVEPERESGVLNDKVNVAEAKVIASIAFEIYQHTKESFDSSTTIGVIVPYRNQISAVQQALSYYKVEPLMDIAIDTVERFQGSQRDYIIYGFTVQRQYQLQFLENNTFEENGHLIDRKLNVAMTRAREYLFLIGNPMVLRHSKVFEALIDDFKANNRFFVDFSAREIFEAAD